MKNSIWVNPRSKGNLGCSLAMEAGVSWLARHAIGWSGTNLDDRHPAFGNRYPQRVHNVTLGDGIEAKGELLRVFSRALQSPEPVHVIDSRAQADRLIIEAMSSLQLLELAKSLDVMIVFWVIPYDDDEHTRNLVDLIEFAEDQVSWLVVQNPTKAPCRNYVGHGIQRALRKLGAREITLPGISSPTMVTLERHCLKLGRELPLAQAALDVSLPALNRAELQAFLGQTYLQLDGVASQLLPPGEVAKIKPAAATPSRTRKTIDLMDDYGA